MSSPIRLAAVAAAGCWWLIAALAAGAWIACSTGSEHGGAHAFAHEHGNEKGHDHGHPAAPADPQAVDLDQPGGLIWKTIALEDHFPAIKIPGAVLVDPDRRVTVSAPLTGRVVQLDARPHSAVEPGQRLAVLSVLDPEVRGLQVRAVELRAELAAATTERDRTRAYLNRLSQSGTGNQSERRRVTSDLAVRQARVASLDSSLAAVLAALKGAGLGAAQREALAQQGQVATRISLRAPILTGEPRLEVAGRPVNLGQTVAAGQPLYELAGLDRLLVVGEAFEADLVAVRKAMREKLPVSLLFPGTSERVDGLSILSLEGALDSDQRLTHFFVPLANRLLDEKQVDGQRYHDWAHRAGSRVQILVATRAPEPRFVLPIEALVSDLGQDLVFRQHDGAIEPVPVLIESRDERQVVVPLGVGLVSGDQILVRGALQVSLAMERKRAGPSGGQSDHGHSH